MILAENEVIDVTMSGNTNPPDRQDGQHGNRSTVFIRTAPSSQATNEECGEWKAVYHRSRKKTMDALLHFDTAAEAMAALTAEAIKDADAEERAWAAHARKSRIQQVKEDDE